MFSFTKASSSSSMVSGSMSDVKVKPAVCLCRTRYEGKDKARKKAHAPEDLRLHLGLVAALRTPAAELGSSASSAVMASLVDPDLVYVFRLISSGTATASTNIWFGSVNLDPTATSEWSSITSLFNMYRLRSARVTVVPAPDTGATGKSNPYIAASINLGEISTNPGSLNAAMVNPNGRMISLIPGMPHRDYQWYTGNIASRFQFQETSGGSLDPYAGAYGQFEYYGFSNGASSTFQYALELEVELRGRS
jgi:hypothetical protein